MQIPDLNISTTTLNRRRAMSFLLLSAAGLALAGCGKDVAEEASDSDANGYLCLDCGAKLYTDRSVFIGPKCPKCQKDRLMEVVGYWCEKDQQLTVRSRVGDRMGTPVCDKCKSPVSAMRLPREKDLKAWGAAKTES
jgi:DNA-directed RNA polymerase subunit RPC12/RpoP